MSKARIESGIPGTFICIPMYYENFFTSFFLPSYDPKKGFSQSDIPIPPEAPIYSMNVERRIFCSGVKVKICVENSH
ncbi:uncharacterized protein BT62DRAFT_925527, partial [Guyanagaster necrorhizus]